MEFASSELIEALELKRGIGEKVSNLEGETK